MNWLNHIPLFRLLLPFTIGIMWAFYNPMPLINFSILAVLLFSGFNIILIRLRHIHSSYHNRWVYGGFATLFFFLVGITVANSRIELFSDTHFSKQNNILAYEGVLISEPEVKPNSIKAIVEIQKVKGDTTWVTSSGKCLVYFKKDATKSLHYGDQVHFLKSPIEISPPSNFDEFDYKRYLAHHYIYHQLYLTPSEYRITGNTPPNWAKEKSITYRNYLLKRYSQFGLENEQLAIISALTLGKKEWLSAPLKSAYSSAGAMHVLAVSGLHVGIIILVLHWLLQWMDRIPYGKSIKAIFLIIAIWMYAFITGLSPSVIRAATMFTFMIFATSFKRKSNIYNTLALSAFVILLFQPFMLLEVGFQLSYLAVIGIIYIHPYLYDLLKLPSGILDKAWNITCVSLSAQLVTAPLGLLYFHQFPSYFLFSNLIVIPAAFAIVLLAILFQVFSFIPLLGEIFAFILNGLVWVLNYLVKQIEILPNSLINGIDITVLETWFMYITIVGIMAWLTQYQRKFAILSLLAILAITATQTFEKWVQLHQKEITIYNIGKEPSFEFTNGQKATFLTDALTFNSTEKMQFHVYHHWWKRGLNSQNTLLFTPTVDENVVANRKAIIAGNTRILKIENDGIYSIEQLNTFQPHIIYVNTYKKFDWATVSTLHSKPLIVIGKSTSKKVREEIKEISKSGQISLIELAKDGAVKITLSKNLTPLAFYTPKTSLNE